MTSRAQHGEVWLQRWRRCVCPVHDVALVDRGASVDAPGAQALACSADGCGVRAARWPLRAPRLFRLGWVAGPEVVRICLKRVGEIDATGAAPGPHASVLRQGVVVGESAVGDAMRVRVVGEASTGSRFEVPRSSSLPPPASADASAAPAPGVLAESSGFFTCDVRSGVVTLRYHADFPGNDAAAQRAALVAVDDALLKHGSKRVLFDTRPIVALVSGAARELAWHWTVSAAYHEYIALVASSEMVQVQANMTARARGVRLRAFGSIEAAMVWLGHAKPPLG